MRKYIEEKLQKMLKRNCTRTNFAERFRNIIEDYNAGGSQNDDFYEKLMRLMEELRAEEERHIKEDLTETELELFDLLRKDSLTGENLSALEKGFANLRLHYENLQKFGLPVVVALNCFSADTPAEISLLQKLCTQCGFSAIPVSAWEHGGSGAVELAEAVVNAVQQPSGYHPLYSPAFPLRQKIYILATQIYRAGSIEYSENASRKLDELQQGGFGNLPVCIAKTQNSVSDNPKLLGAPENHVFHVNDIRLSAGAGFVVILSGSILTMPGLPAHPAAENIDITDDGIISGLF